MFTYAPAPRSCSSTSHSDNLELRSSVRAQRKQIIQLFAGVPYTYVHTHMHTCTLYVHTALYKLEHSSHPPPIPVGGCEVAGGAIVARSPEHMLLHRGVRADIDDDDHAHPRMITCVRKRETIFRLVGSRWEISQSRAVS